MPGTSPSTIGFVLPWFGPLPPYARYFFKGVEANPTVDVHVWADQARPSFAELPNVRWSRTTLPAFVDLLQQALATRLEVPAAYKLCDLKPAYGEALADRLRDASGRPYDFWAFGDMDVLWGNLRGHFTPEWLAEVDFASFCGPWHLGGAFQLFRTNSAATGLFRRSPHWRAVFADPASRFFDEDGKRFDGREHTVAELLARGEMVTMTDLAREAHAAGELRLVTPYWECRPGAWWHPTDYPSVDVEWDHGELFDRVSTENTVLYVHFFWMRRERFYRWSRLGGPAAPLPDHFHIGPWGPSHRPATPLTRWAGAALRPRFVRYVVRTMLRPPRDGVAEAQAEGSTRIEACDLSAGPRGDVTAPCARARPIMRR